MIEFQTIDGRVWRTDDKEFNLALESIKAWPNGAMIFRGGEAWNVYNRAIVAWRPIPDPMKQMEEGA